MTSYATILLLCKMKWPVCEATSSFISACWVRVALALVYVYVARMGATASLEGFRQAPAFLAGALIWILIHGAFCVACAWIFKVDLHSAAIASAANIGGVASAPVVAAHHRETLVPVAILMALLGNALGNYMALLAAQLARLAGTL